MSTQHNAFGDLDLRRNTTVVKKIMPPPVNEQNRLNTANNFYRSHRHLNNIPPQNQTHHLASEHKP